jgi:transcription antitermination factor NusG
LPWCVPSGIRIAQIQQATQIRRSWILNDQEAVSNSPWYALRVQQRLAKLVSVSLRVKGYEEFLPLCGSMPTLTGITRKEQDIPLFPGYLFCRFDVRDRLLPILTTPGVISIVGIGKTPVAVSEEEVDSIKAVIRSGLHSKAAPFLPTGSKVVLKRGPLAGLEGIVIGLAEKYRLVVSVTLLQRSVSVEIDPHWLSDTSTISNFVPQVADGRASTAQGYRA